MRDHVQRMRNQGVVLETRAPRRLNCTMEVMSKRDWDCLDRRVSTVIVGDNCCNEESLTKLDLSGFVNLRELKVGSECFVNVKEVTLAELSELESVEIGSKSFVVLKGSSDDLNGRFHLKNCPKLQSLTIGDYSFSFYSVIEIKHVDALEVIEISKGNVHCYNFRYASLELKSD